MTLILSVQPYSADADLYDEITIYCVDPDQPVLPLVIIEQHLKSLKLAGYITDLMNLSVCLWEEKCSATMQDTSEIVAWFSTAVSNLHDDQSAWW